MLSKDIIGVAVTAARPTLYRQLIPSSDLDTLSSTAILGRGNLPDDGTIPDDELYVLNGGWEGTTAPFSEVVSARVSGGDGAAGNTKQGQERRITMPIAWSSEEARHPLNEVLQQRKLQVIFRRSDGSDTENDRKLIFADELTEKQIAEAVYDHEVATGALLIRSDFPWFVGGDAETTTLTSSDRAVSLPDHSEGPCIYGLRFGTPTGNTVTVTIQDTFYSRPSPERGREWTWTWNVNRTDPSLTAAEFIFFCQAPVIGGFEFYDSSTSSGTVDGDPVREGSVNGILPYYLKSYRSYTAAVSGAPCTLYVWPSWRAA